MQSSNESSVFPCEWFSIARSATVQSRAVLEHPVHLAPQSEVHNDSEIGRCTFLNIRSVVYPNVRIGRYCSIARNCEIGVTAHPMEFLSTHSFQYSQSLFPGWPEYCDMTRRVVFSPHAKTSIGNDVWIGAQAVIIAGVSIGDGAVIAANSVVTKDVAPYSIVAGSPAQHIRFRFNAAQVEDLLLLKWWEIPVSRLAFVKFDDIDSAINELKLMRDQDRVPVAHGPSL
ncbi:CatB-related O-acetyltransferase [Cupriavidus metallidurans]|uniref:CatB-related O-acetyltransferase n=1 Tax=Cupriavidus metallidurans TaxID=119219 RepID=UPI001644B036|nr:CatB-related O-acetyltransferase [Cupriavidus metallidurans]